MNIKLRAFLYTVGIFASITIASFATVAILEMIPQEYYYTIFISALVALGFCFVYSICKAQLEFQDKMKAITAKK